MGDFINLGFTQVEFEEIKMDGHSLYDYLDTWIYRVWILSELGLNLYFFKGL